MTTLKEALDQLSKGHELDNEQKKLIIDKWQKELGIQSCEDAISRADALSEISSYFIADEDENGTTYQMAYEDGINTAYEVIEKLPPVTPPPKIGHWIKKEDELCWWYECDQCGEKPLHNRLNDKDVLSDWCPNCGAKMVEPQESEKI